MVHEPAKQRTPEHMFLDVGGSRCKQHDAAVVLQDAGNACETVTDHGMVFHNEPGVGQGAQSSGCHLAGIAADAFSLLQRLVVLRDGGHPLHAWYKAPCQYGIECARLLGVPLAWAQSV